MKNLRLFIGLLIALGICVIITYVFIISQWDWKWAVFFNENETFVWMASPFVLAGMIVPLLIIGNFWLRFRKNGNPKDRAQFLRSLYTFISTYITMTVLKVFTNRVDMEPFEPIGTIDTSDQFRFGFMNSNSWWESFSEGWPSGHTMITFGMAIAIHPLLHKSVWRTVNIVYAILVALSVSTAFHWISDVISGTLLGLVWGVYYRNKTFT